MTTKSTKSVAPKKVVKTAAEKENAALREKNGDLATEIAKLIAAIGAISVGVISVPPPHITFRQRFAGYFSSSVGWVKKNTLTFVQWILVFLLIYLVAIASFLVVERYSNSDKNTATILTMTQTDYELFRSAARLVNNDVGKFATVGEALSAFYAESPVSVRDAVLEQLGNVRSLDDFPGALENVLGRVVVTGAPVEGFSRVSPSIITPETTDGNEPGSPDVLPTVEKKETPPTAKTTVGQQRIFRRR